MPSICPSQLAVFVLQTFPIPATKLLLWLLSEQKNGMSFVAGGSVDLGTECCDGQKVVAGKLLEEV